MDGRVIGFIMGQEFDDHFWAQGLYVSEAAQGLGPGTMLAKARVHWMMEQDQNKLVKLFVAHYAPAVRFHEKCGFERYGEVLEGPVGLVEMRSTPKIMHQHLYRD